jgi:hypothetical protein
MRYGLGDIVEIKNGGTQTYKITQASDSGPRYLLQLGNDGTKIQWKMEDEIELVAKAKQPGDDSPGFVPERGIMG